MGKATARPPDYTQLANASAEAARYGKEMSQLQLDFSKKQYDDLKPMFDSVMAQQLRMADASEARSNEYYQHWKDNAAPMERQMAQEADRFNSEAFREQEAQKARGSMETAFATADQSRARQMASMGINPNSGRAMASGGAMDLMKGAQTANAMNAGRQQAEQLGYARKLDATGLFRGMPGASQGAYAMAGQLGSSALNSGAANGNNYMSNMANGINTAIQGQQMNLGGLSSIMGNQSQLYGQQLAQNNSSAQGWGSLAGLAAGGLMGGTFGDSVGNWLSGKGFG